MMLGIAVLFFAPAALVALGCALRTRRRAWIATAALLSTLCAFQVWGGIRQLHHFDGVNLNPQVDSSHLIGVWSNARVQLVLAPDGGATDMRGEHVSWMYFTAQNGLEVGDRALTVLSRDGGLLILDTEMRADPDEWNLGAALERR